MRFYGLSEDKMFEVIEKIESGSWILEEDGRIEKISQEEAKTKLRELLEKVKEWKEKSKHIPPGTLFFFVSTPNNPQAIKVYDLSSLGCSSSLDPAKWKIYKEEFKGKV